MLQYSCPKLVHGCSSVSGQHGATCQPEVQAFFDNEFFEVGYHDVDELMNGMDTDDNGNIDFAEFRRAVLEDPESPQPRYAASMNA
eukprot:1925580-Amphidinium_carterae.1